MNWSDVGTWLKDNAGQGTALVGSLLTGNVPAAVAAGVALVTSATGAATPDAAMYSLQSDPATVVRLKELYYQNEASIREHVRALTEADLLDKQAEHRETQETIRNADNAEDPFVRRTRPAQSWVSLVASIAYVFTNTEPDVYILGLLLALPWSYAGLRQIGKGIEVVRARKK